MTFGQQSKSPVPHSLLVLFPARLWPGLTDGSVTVAFRRWKRPTVKKSATRLSPAGLLGIDEVAIIEPADVTDEDARAACYRTRNVTLADLRPDGSLYRVRFHRIGDDPRRALRERVDSTRPRWRGCARGWAASSGPSRPSASWLPIRRP